MSIMAARMTESDLLIYSCCHLPNKGLTAIPHVKAVLHGDCKATYLAAGLFQITGPVAVPSASDLEALDAVDPRRTIETLPSRQSLQQQASQLSAALSSEGLGRRPSLESQLRPIDSRTLQSWFPAATQSR